MKIKKIILLSLLMIAINSLQTMVAQVTLQGKISDAKTAEPLPGATVFIPDLKTGVATDKNGLYHIKNLPKSKLLIQVSFMGYRSITSQIDLTHIAEMNFQLSESVIEAQEVVITGSGISTDNSRSSISIIPISKNAILTTPSTNIIDAIADVPGLSEITTGGDISKPVIRGLSYNHVVTLNEGVRQEGQQWGDEHGIEIDQFSADRIEVLKGPASLFYGSDAMGGVINILEPVHAPENSVRGEMASQFATNNMMTNSSLMMEGNHNGFLWRARGSYKNAGAYKSPPEYVYNSGFNEMNYSAMLGLNKKWGFSHLHFSKYDANIGMVEGASDSSIKRKPELPFQNVQHYKLTSVTNLIFGSSQLRFNLGFQTNNRWEFEESKDDPGLFLHLNTYTYDVKYTHLFTHEIELVGGASGMSQTNTNKGEEYLIPDYTLQDIGTFIYLKKSWTKWTLNAGMRYDVRWITGNSLYLLSPDTSAPKMDTVFPGFHSVFSAFSGSSGFTYAPSRVFNFKFNLGSGFRSPNIAELGSNGVHPGTFRYEIGNPELKPENSFQIDGEISASLRWISITFSGFYNYIFNYIYQRNINGEETWYDGQLIKVYRYVQGNSSLKGFEFEIDFHPVDALHFDNSIDYVMGTNESTGIPLPYIPALHSIHEIKWTFKTSKKSKLLGPYLSVGAEINYAQNRIDTFETTSSGYFILNASAGTRLKVQNQVWTIFIAGKNLTNTKYFDHLSRLKDVGVYNPGWGLTAGLIIPFGIYEKK